MKAFIFDFDGVIIDSERHWDNDAYDVYHSFIPTFTRKDDADLKGRNMHDIYAMLVQKFGLTLTKDEYMKIIDRYASTVYREKAVLIPGVQALIKRLQDAHIPIAIASSGELTWINIALERLNMRGVFPLIVMAADVGVGKPDPAVYLETARRMGVKPEECIALEDSTNGIKSATAAGITCIAIKHPWGYPQDLSQADRIVESMDEVTMELLEGF